MLTIKTLDTKKKNEKNKPTGRIKDSFMYKLLNFFEVNSIICYVVL